MTFSIQWAALLSCTSSGWMLTLETEKDKVCWEWDKCIFHILVVPFWIWYCFKDGLVLSATETEGARRRGPPSHCLGCPTAFMDQMPKNVLGTCSIWKALSSPKSSVCQVNSSSSRCTGFAFCFLLLGQWAIQLHALTARQSCFFKPFTLFSPILVIRN